MSSLIKGIHHISISVPSIEKAKDFFVDLLGFELVDEVRFRPTKDGDSVTELKDADSKMIMVNAGNIFIEIFEFITPPPDSSPKRKAVNELGYTHFAIEVTDIEKSYLELEQGGVKWHHPPIDSGDGYLMTYGRDPFGNVIEIQEIKSDQPFSYNQLSI